MVVFYAYKYFPLCFHFSKEHIYACIHQRVRPFGKEWLDMSGHIYIIFRKKLRNVGEGDTSDLVYGHRIWA
jgi:hypothetical protein